MEVGQLISQFTSRIAVHEQESAAFAEEVERGRDVLESSNGQKYHDGCADTLRETVMALKQLQTADLAVSENMLN